MPDIKISDLTAATSASGAQQIEVNDSGTSKRITVDQIKAYVVSAGSINATALGTDAVTTVKILNGAVTPAKLSTGGLYWDTSGNVGIGTSSPNGKLDIQTTITAGQTAPLQLWSWNSSAAGYLWGMKLDQIHTGSAIDYSFRIRNNSTTDLDALYLKSNGNVGIGGAPGAKLHVFGTSGTAQLQVGTASGGGYLQFNAYDANPGYCVIGGTNITAGVFGTQANIPTIFFTNNTECVRIGTSGQLGIGGANYGTAGQVLTSGGSGAAPSWATPAGGFSNMQVFTSSGTFTVPTGITKVKVTVVGGGGNGGSYSSGGSTANATAGGGAGGVAIKIVSGLSGTVSVTVGGAGGTSSFGAYCSATGGATGGGASGNGGAGGVGSGGDLNLQASNGNNNDASTSFGSNCGASSPYGRGGLACGNPGVSILNGNAGTGYGVGGGGGARGAISGSYSGGAGASGVVIVEY